MAEKYADILFVRLCSRLSCKINLIGSNSDHFVLEKGHKIDRRLTLCYLFSSIGVAVLYLLFPIFKVIYDYITTGAADDWIMPMRSM